MKLPGITLLAGSLLLAPAAFASTRANQNQERTRPTHEEMINRHVDRLAIELNLTPEQKKEASSYFETAYNQDHDVAMQLRQARKTLRQDINAKADQSKLNADAMTIGQDQGKIVANNANAQEKFVSILTPEEQAKYQKLQSTRPSNWGGMAPGTLYR